MKSYVLFLIVTVSGVAQAIDVFPVERQLMCNELVKANWIYPTQLQDCLRNYKMTWSLGDTRGTYRITAEVLKEEIAGQEGASDVAFVCHLSYRGGENWKQIVPPGVVCDI